MNIIEQLEKEHAEELQAKRAVPEFGPGDTLLYRPENNDHNGDWLRAIRTRKKTICNEEVAYRSGSLCMLMALSDRIRRPILYDPVQGNIIGDEEASRLLGTPKRAPWRTY